MTNTQSSPIPPEATYIGSLPRNWEQAFGYDGQARWLAVYWQPVGDEAVCDDGRVAGDGAWWIFSDLVDHALVGPLIQVLPRSLGLAALGSSDAEATHCLLLDLQERQVYVSPIDLGLRFVHNQWPPERPLSPDELDALFQALADLASEAPQETTFRICQSCFHGWLKADDGGYDPCPQCGGRWLIPEGANG
jgi:hypothetical protein